jgi:hypothetical protein
MMMTCNEVTSRLLPILREQMKYPNDHKFDHQNKMDAKRRHTA